MPSVYHEIHNRWQQLSGAKEERLAALNETRDPANGLRAIPKRELKDLCVEIGVYGLLMVSPASSAVAVRAFFADPDFTEMPLEFPGVDGLLSQLFDEHEALGESAMAAITALAGKTWAEAYLGRPVSHDDLERAGVL